MYQKTLSDLHISSRVLPRTTELTIRRGPPTLDTDAYTKYVVDGADVERLSRLSSDALFLSEVLRVELQFDGSFLLSIRFYEGYIREDLREPPPFRLHLKD